MVSSVNGKTGNVEITLESIKGVLSIEKGGTGGNTKKAVNDIVATGSDISDPATFSENDRFLWVFNGSSVIKSRFVTLINYIKSKLSAVASSGSYNDLTNKPTTMKNPKALTFTGGASLSYDGSVEKTVNIPSTLPANGGTAQTISDTLPISKGGTGATTAQSGLEALTAGARTESENYGFSDNDSVLWMYTSANSGAIYKTKFVKVWNYIKSKLANVATSGSYNDLTNKPAIPVAATATPKAAGTAAVGTGATWARADHVHPAQTTVSGNSGTATKLATARTIRTNLASTATANFDGSANVSPGVTGTLPVANGGTGNTSGTVAKLTTPRSIDGINFDGSAAITHYGTCSTAAATAAKVVACAGFTLVTGAVIRVKFTVTNTAANPTLNVNSKGAKAIYYRGAAISAGYLAANRTYEFVYNGTQFELVGDIDTNTTYGVATQTANGLFSAADKKKLDGIATNATKNVITFATAAPSTLADGAIVMVYEE